MKKIGKFILCILIFLFGFIAGKIKDTPKNKMNNSILEYSTYILDHRSTISFDSNNKKYYYSENGMTTIVGHYLVLDSDVVCFSSGILMNCFAIYIDNESKIKIIDIQEDKTISTWDKYDDQLTIRGTLIDTDAKSD